MTKNMGLIDRIARMAVSVIIAAMILNGQLRGVGGILLGILVGVLIITSVVGVCPAYLPFGIDTRAKGKDKLE
jgi:hypothetical protein